jgi:hypothetical protein
MLSRGTFNGPGGPHSRWMIPPTGGASMGAHHMLRNKIELEMVDEANVLRLSRDALDETGLVVARVTARAVQPGPRGLSGIDVAFDTGDKSPACSTAADPLCDGGRYENYTVEVVDRMGSDSFTPDSGVLLAKTKNQDRAPLQRSRGRRRLGGAARPPRLRRLQAVGVGESRLVGMAAERARDGTRRPVHDRGRLREARVRAPARPDRVDGDLGERRERSDTATCVALAR